MAMALCSTILLFCGPSNMGDSNLHSHKDVGHMLIGGAMGQHKGGRHIRAEGSTANLLLTTLGMFGVEKQNLGDSTETPVPLITPCAGKSH